MPHAPPPSSVWAPEPPPFFVGRERERELLRLAFERGPLTLVTGAPGIGKTATVLQVLQESFSDRPIVFVGLSGLPEGMAPDRELVRAIAPAASVTQIAWSSVLRMRDSLPEVLLDTAESSRLCLFLDGVVAGPMVRELVAMVSQYARHSRWIVAGDGFQDRDVHPSRVVRLGPLPHDALERLAQHVVPDRLEWREAVRAAEGNPGALLRAILPSTSPVPMDPLLSALLTLADADTDAVLAWLKLHGEEAIREGYARNLYTTLAGRRHEPVLVRWWTRCAAEVGDIGELPDDAGATASLADALTILSARSAGGDLLRSLHDARTLGARARAEGAPRIAGEASIVLARCLAMNGDVAGALSTLDALETDDVELACMRDASAAAMLVMQQRPEDAHARLEALLARAPELSLGAQNPLLYRAADILYRLGHLERAHDVLTQIMTPERERSFALHHAGITVFLQACIATDHGALPEAAELQERIRPFAREGSLLQPFVGANRAYRRLWVGDFAGLLAELREAMQLGHDRGYREAQCWAAIAAIEVALETGSELPQLVHDPLVVASREGTVASALLGETLRRAKLRSGEQAPPEPSPHQGVEHRLIAYLGEVDAHVLRGAWSEAIASCRESIALAARWGYRPRESQARSMLACLLLAEGRDEEATQEAAALGALAEAIGSPRFVLEAELWSHLATPERTLLPLLEWAARESSPSPFVSRCARRLLGGPSGADAIEGKLFERLQSRIHGVESHDVDRVPSWCIVDADRTVHLSDGRCVSLEAKPLVWRLLVALWEGGREVDKEALVRAVWDQDEYHPLRDDNRLYVTMSKLRAAIDTQPPIRVVTTPRGYALGGAPVRVRRKAR